ncbi:ABC transporter permease [Salipiger abyssi]|uniref:Peptide/nickel transport system permease protein n=1 Tax=Salipiger abyssi TaxID=1250539 RepID=A0A1P8UMR0_9RHOB|nr:ABC transporter permease [Salipiger abyssi]APZ50648.1 peptide/nickel transport system permease protein [Salipiger abyssi]
MTYRIFLTRLGNGLLVLIGVAIMNFTLVHMAPGDPAMIFAGEAGGGDETYVEQLREDMGLDKPLVTQFAIYAGDLLRGDLGYSFRNQRDVAGMIAERIPATLLLTMTAFGIALIIGVVFGMLGGWFRNTLLDRGLMIVTLVLYATPLFWLAMMFVLLFSVRLGWFPPFGMQSVLVPDAPLERMLDVGRHLVLPAFSLGLFYAATYARLMRASVINVSNADFVKTARAKGVPGGRILRVHVLRNAILPVFSLASVQIGQLIGGAVLTETVFAWPGIGRLMFDAILQRDYPVILGVFLTTALLVILVNIATDLLYRIVDPRIETGAGS